MTAVLLVTSWWALRPRDWRAGLVYAAVALAVYGGIRLSVGDVPNGYTLESVFAGNTQPWALRSFVVYGALLLPLAGAAVPHWRRAAAQHRRLVLVLTAVYLPLWLALAAWQEIRLLMPLIVLLLPIVTRESHAT